MSARGVFDLRLHVEGVDEAHVYALVAAFVERARAVAPEGVGVRYSQLRPPRASVFRATMAPAWWRRKQRGEEPAP